MLEHLTKELEVKLFYSTKTVVSHLNVVVFRNSEEFADFRQLVSQGFMVVTSLDPNQFYYKKRSVSFRLAK